jgi:hypothetical protein
VEECWREGVNGLIEAETENYASEGRGKLFDGLVEFGTEAEMGERRGDRINRLIEFIP